MEGESEHGKLKREAGGLKLSVLLTAGIPAAACFEKQREVEGLTEPRSKG
jgi:hypothetical protein